MSSGTFKPGETKVRPGQYFNIIAQQQLIGLSLKGTVIMPLMDWDYSSKEFISITIDDVSGSYPNIGYNITDKKMILIREILKNAIKVIVYNPCGGTKASLTSGALTVTAKKAGERGNKLKLAIKDSASIGKTVELYMCNSTTDIELVYSQDNITKIEDLNKNNWVDFSGTGLLLNDAGTNLTGGTTTTASNQDIQDFLDDCETQEFNVLYFPNTDATNIGNFDNKIKYFIEKVGKQVQGVRPWVNVNADYEYISQIENGVILQDGTKLNATQAAAGFAGMSAVSQPYESLTFIKYPQAIDTNPRLKHSQVIESLNGGRIAFTLDNNNVVVEQDINSLTTITKDKNNSFKKNRVIRTIMEIKKLSQVYLRPNLFDNNETGIANVNDTIASKILLELQGLGALKEVDTKKDIIVDYGKTKGDEYHAQVDIKPVDSIEKFYITLNSRI